MLTAITITTLNNLAINRSDTAAADQLWTATSATATDFQAAAAGGALIRLGTTADAGSGSPAYIDFTSVFSSTSKIPSLPGSCFSRQYFKILDEIVFFGNVFRLL